MSATHGLAGLFGAAVSSVGLDDTDGPMKVAGGYTDGDTTATLHARGLDAFEALAQNDAYHALRSVDSPIFADPTGTNVNDITMALLKG